MTTSAPLQSSPRAPLRGVYAAVLTPCKSDMNCDIETLTDHCKDLLQKGCRGIVLFGTTGEGPSFSVAERKKIMISLIDNGLNPSQLLIGISCCAIADAVELAQESLKYHCAGVLIIPPFFYKNLDDVGVIAFYREVISRVENSDLRIILYHIPQFSGISITLKVIEKLYREFPSQIIGIKESEGNITLMREILRQFPGFQVFVGNELLVSEMVGLGASGGILGIANLFPELACSLYRLGEGLHKLDENEKMITIRHMLRKYPIIAALKGVMESRKGAAWHILRPPLLPLEATQLKMLNEELKKLN